jgi:hypothetical protein
VFQAGAKYWLVLSLMLCATLLSLHYDPALISLNPAFGFVAASLAMSERVEATVSKVRPACCAVLRCAVLCVVLCCVLCCAVLCRVVASTSLLGFVALSMA